MQELKPFEQKFSSVNLIEAAAGSGKTYNITALFLRYLIEQKAEVHQILVVTFTRAATSELKQRLLTIIQKAIVMLRTDGKVDDHLLKDLKVWIENSSIKKEEALAHLKKAERNFNRAQISTIHAFCNKMLQNEAFQSGNIFEGELIEGEANRKLVQEVTDDYWGVLNKPENVEKPLTQYLLKTHETPEKLLGCVYSFLGKTYLQIIPDELSVEKFEQVLNEYQAAFEDLKACWKSEREVIWELMGHEDLSRYGQYRASRIKKVENWLLADSFYQRAPDAFRFFCQSVINTKLLAGPKKTGKSAPDHPFFVQADTFVAVQQQKEALEGACYEFIINNFRKALRAEKESREVLSYDDVLLQLKNALLNDNYGERLAGKLRKNYPVALVDEFQDTDPVQYEIFKAIYGGNDETELFMVGDPKQAIYNFRGADVFVYLQAREDSDEKARFKLSHNYRSVPLLLKGVNYLFSRIEKPFILDDIRYQPMKPGKIEPEYDYLKIDSKKHKTVQLWDLNYPDTKNKAQLNQLVENETADEIARLISLGRVERATIGSKKLEEGDIAILVRKNKQGEAMQKALQKRGVKSILIGKKSVFATDEAFELELLLKAIAEPGDESKLAAAMATRFIGFWGEEIAELSNDESNRIREINRFAKWSEAFENHTFVYAFRAVLQDARIALRLMEYNDGERRITNLYHLSELLQQYEREAHVNLPGLIKWLARKRKDKEVENTELQLRLESDENLVVINTLHQSKGLEYPIVFCPYLWQGMKVENANKPFIFHDKQGHKSTAFLDVGAESDERSKNLFQKYREDLSEEMRLAYVAMTRAKQCCYLPWVKDTNNKTSSSVSALGIILNGQDEGLKYLKGKSGQGKKENTDSDYGKAFEQIRKEADEFISTQKPKTEGFQNEFFQNHVEKLEARKWKGREQIQAENQVASFSYLALGAKTDFEEHDYDQWIYQAEQNEEKGDELTMINFPRGVKTGRCIHHIFEKIDFRLSVDDKKNSNIIEAELERQGVEAKWKKILQSSIQTTLDKPLAKGKSELKLKNIKPDYEQREMEFYFPMQAANTTKIMNVIRGDGRQLSKNNITGFMKGFIDLVFCHEGRYYILDYKSNYLGDEIEDYDAEGMRQSIDSHFYDLQYYIYTAAVHKMLTCSLEKYEYSTHFGGVFYLFLRGICDGPSRFNGIYFARPPFEKMDQLNRILTKDE